MNCRKANHLLSAYIDGELAGVEHLQVQQHLRDCPCCQAEYESLLATKRMLSGLCMKRPRPDLETRILDELGTSRAPSHGLFGLRAWWSVLTERQRHSVRMLYLCGTLCCLSVVLLGSRISRTLQQQVLPAPSPVPAMFAEDAEPPAVMVRERAPQAHLADLLDVHNGWGDAEPTRSAPTATNASAGPMADPFSGPPPARANP